LHANTRLKKIAVYAPAHTKTVVQTAAWKARDGDRRL
jgi:hypothetical protein